MRSPELHPLLQGTPSPSSRQSALIRHLADQANFIGEFYILNGLFQAKIVFAFVATLIFGFGQAIYDANSSIHVSAYLLSMTPYLLTLIVLAAVVRRSSPPAADGIPYVPGAE